MSEATSSIEGLLADFPTPILPNIGGEPTREGLIKLHRLVSGNVASMLSNLRGGWHGHLTLKMASKEYAAQTGFAFVPPHKPVNYPPTMGYTQYQALGTEKLQKNQALFQKYTSVGGALKNKMITAV